MPAPIKHTCPDIDRLLQRLKEAARELGYLDIEQAQRNSIDWELETVRDGLEDLRRSNASLRDWGEALESKLERAEESIENRDERISELEDQLARLVGREAEILNDVQNAPKA